MAIGLTIAGTDRTKSLRLDTYRVGRRLRAATTFTGTLEDPGATFRPGLLDAVVFTNDGTTVFSGLLTSVQEEAVYSNSGNVFRITAQDASIYLAARLVTKTFSAGTTLYDAVNSLVSTYLTGFGVTHNLTVGDPGPVLGPLTYTNVPLTQVAADLALRSGYFQSFSPTKVWTWVDPADATAAAWSVSEADTKILAGTLRIEQSWEGYCNSVSVEYGSAPTWIENEQHDGNGTLREWTLNCPTTYVNTAGYVAVTDGGVTTYYPLGLNGTDDIAWTYKTSTNSIIQKSSETVLGSGDSFTISYTAILPATVTVTNSGEIAAHGTWEKKLQAPGILNGVQADALADAELAKGITTPQTVYGQSRSTDIEPGEAWSINLPTSRNLSSVTAIVEEVEIHHDDEGLLVVDVTAVIGTTPAANWRDLYQQWSTGGIVQPGGATDSAPNLWQQTDTDELAADDYGIKWGGGAALASSNEVALHDHTHAGYYATNATLTPAAGDTYNLGASGTKFQDLFLNGVVYMDDPGTTTSPDYPIVWSDGNLRFYYKTDGDNSSYTRPITALTVERGIVTSVSEASSSVTETFDLAVNGGGSVMLTFTNGILTSW